MAAPEPVEDNSGEPRRDVLLRVVTPPFVVPEQVNYVLSNLFRTGNGQDPRQTRRSGRLDELGQVVFEELPDTGFLLELSWQDSEDRRREWIDGPLQTRERVWQVDPLRTNSRAAADLRVNGSSLPFDEFAVIVNQEFGASRERTRVESGQDSVAVHVLPVTAGLSFEWDLDEGLRLGAGRVEATLADSVAFPFEVRKRLELERIYVRFHRAWSEFPPSSRSLFWKRRNVGAWDQVVVRLVWDGSDVWPALVGAGPLFIQLSPPSTFSDQVPAIDGWFAPAAGDTLDIDFGSLRVRVRVETSSGEALAFRAIRLRSSNRNYADVRALTDHRGEHAFLLPPGNYVVTMGDGPALGSFTAERDSLLVLRESG